MGKRPIPDNDFLFISEMAERVTGLTGKETDEHWVKRRGEKGKLKFVVLNKGDETTELRPAFNYTNSIYLITNCLPLSTKQFNTVLKSTLPWRIALVDMVIDGNETTLRPSPFRSYTKNDLRIRIEDAREFEEESGITSKIESHDNSETKQINSSIATKFTIHEQRITCLQEAIESNGLETLQDLGRLRVWNILCEKHRSLFGASRDSAEDGMVKGFFDNQVLITFRSGRRPKR